MNIKKYVLIGRIASVLSILMYVSYIAQIYSNLVGAKGNPIQPLVASINSAFWVAYGWNLPRRDWPIMIANAPGVIFGIITAITCL